MALLAKTQRAKATRAQDLQEALQQVPCGEQLIVISDSPSQHWRELVPSAHPQVPDADPGQFPGVSEHHRLSAAGTFPQAILINIREVRFKKRSMKLQPSGSS